MSLNRFQWFGLGACAAALVASMCLPQVANAFSPPAVLEKAKFKIAIQPTTTPEKLAAQSKELETFLESRMANTDVEIYVPTLYAGVVEALRFGHADAAFVGAWPARLASDRAGARLVLAEVREVFANSERLEQPYYYSYWIVKPESDIRSLADLRGKKVAFPSRLSTSGFVFPLSKLVEQGLVEVKPEGADPATFFGEVLFAGGYTQALDALMKGQVDVTVIAGDVPRALYDKALASTRTIAEQGPIPSHAVVVAKHVPDDQATMFTDALFELGAEAHRPLMRSLISGIFLRFEKADADKHLSALRTALDKTGLGWTETMR